MTTYTEKETASFYRNKLVKADEFIALAIKSLAQAKRHLEQLEGVRGDLEALEEDAVEREAK